jgi:hypothetical protein
MHFSSSVKATGDVCAVSTATLAFFKAIPWPEIAACLAAIYTAIRIAELCWSWYRGRHPHD